MEKFVAIFAIDGRTTNVQFEVAEKDTIDIRIEYDVTNKQKPIKTTVKRHKENEQPQRAAETDVCGTYENISEVIAVNRLEGIACKRKD
ncbi:MAG: hypothetical protein JNL13_07350 [Chitinophagaceae bacterium]|nr:hypothetical protein [Chitinophagaceae bacterium]